MLLRVLSSALGSLIAVLVRYCTTNCIGSTSPTGFSSSYSSDSLPTSERQRTTVSVLALHRAIAVSSADTRRHLRSANRHLLAVPRFRLNTYGRQAFSVAGPIAWNSLPDFIWDPTNSTDCFRPLLKTHLFARYYSASSALGVLNDCALYKSTHSLTHSSRKTDRLAIRRRQVGLNTSIDADFSLFLWVRVPSIPVAPFLCSFLAPLHLLFMSLFLR